MTVPYFEFQHIKIDDIIANFSMIIRLFYRIWLFLWIRWCSNVWSIFECQLVSVKRLSFRHVRQVLKVKRVANIIIFKTIHFKLEILVYWLLIKVEVFEWRNEEGGIIAIYEPIHWKLGNSYFRGSTLGNLKFQYGGHKMVVGVLLLL